MRKLPFPSGCLPALPVSFELTVSPMCCSCDVMPVGTPALMAPKEKLLTPRFFFGDVGLRSAFVHM